MAHDETVKPPQVDDPPAIVAAMRVVHTLSSEPGVTVKSAVMQDKGDECAVTIDVVVKKPEVMDDRS